MKKSDYNIIRKLGQLSGEAVITYDLKKRKISFYNETFLDFFNLKDSEIKKDPELLLKRLVIDDVQYVRNRYNEFLRDGKVTNAEFRVKAKKYVRYVSADAIMVEENELIVVLIKDITELRIHQDYAVDFGAQKDTLLDMLTHNLNGPLLISRDIINNVTASPTPKDVKEMSRVLSLIKDNTEQCIDIVNDFLRKEHDASIRTVIKSIRFDTVEKIQVTLLKLKELNKNKTFNVKAPKDPLVITADAVKFFQVIHNMLSNAIKYTSENGKIEILVKEEQNDVVICVKDNGIGIPQSLQKKIFKGPVTSRKGLRGENSSGLGLSIVKKLVDRMDGEVWCESEEKKGSSFFVRLPKEYRKV